MKLYILSWDSGASAEQLQHGGGENMEVRRSAQIVKSSSAIHVLNANVYAQDYSVSCQVLHN